MANELMDIFMDRNPGIVKLSEWIDVLQEMENYNGSDFGVLIPKLATNLIDEVFKEIGSQTQYLLNEMIAEDQDEDTGNSTKKS